MLPWVFIAMPMLSLAFSLSLRREVRREHELRRRLKEEGVRTEALVTNVQVMGYVPGSSFMVLSLHFAGPDGGERWGTAMAARQPHAHSLRKQVLEVVYLPTRPKQARLVSDLNNDGYPRQLQKAIRHQMWLTGLLTIAALVQLASWYVARANT